MPGPELTRNGTHIAFYLALQLCKLLHESSMHLDLRQVSFQVGKLTDKQTSKWDVETLNETMKGEKLVLASITSELMPHSGPRRTLAHQPENTVGCVLIPQETQPHQPDASESSTSGT